MSLIPAFELGLWNAWIFLVPSVLSFPIFFYLAKVKGVQRPSDVSYSNPMMVFCVFSKLVYFVALVYSFFLPLKLGTLWFYIGLPLTLIGLVTLTIAIINYATTPWDKPIMKGLYHYSRHPMYIAIALFLLGIGVASASWLFLSYQ